MKLLSILSDLVGLILALGVLALVVDGLYILSGGNLTAAAILAATGVILLGLTAARQVRRRVYSDMRASARANRPHARL